MSSTVSAFVTGRRIAVCGTLMSEQKRMASGLWSLGAITGFVHQVVGCLLGTVLMTPCSLNSVPHVQLFGLNCKGFVSVCVRQSGYFHPQSTLPWCACAFPGQRIRHDTLTSMLTLQVLYEWGLLSAWARWKQQAHDNLLRTECKMRYTRLNYVTISAQDIFDKVMDDTISGLQGELYIRDDFIVLGRDNTEHDRALENLLQRFRECGLTFNPKKCKFRLPQIEFFGFVF